MKNSLGIWAFGPLVTRFTPRGFHPEAANMTAVDMLRKAQDGLGDLVDGYEFHYPAEINEDNMDEIRATMGQKHDLYAVALGAHMDPKNGRGAFTNPDPKIREKNVETAERGIDIASEFQAKFIIWPGIDGYNYPFQSDYQKQWAYFLNGIKSCVEYANSKNVTVLLEHKNSEPAMKIYMRNVGMMLYVIHKLRDEGVDTARVKVNMDWQHLIMNGENLAEYASLLAVEDLLGHMHSNSGWGTFDDDNMTGATHFMETLELAAVLQDIGYGNKGERIGFDLFPYTEDPIEAIAQSVRNWNFIYRLAKKIDRKSLKEAQKNKDAVEAIKTVYRTLGAEY